MTITNTLTVSVAASADATQRALSQLDLSHVDARVEADHEDSSWLTIVTRFTATDELDVLRRRARLAARAVKHHAEEDRFETIEVDAMAA
jgi:hypothetical protein